ncbi:hypothetical protein BU23DRAFT_244658 [Bimuria novae-zelandiae CBS 107.79]|uniref:Uncharacterized protein n=1 Tax=Bimuria novae-zelandiae CBS 107.79 TaxID=1447943 RepID=A0A6A5UWN7_9PLEO|nr:hypothetical protein BU23DRAFT_244658 [Bimuria novae-zelandiae CBS 107.79]
MWNATIERPYIKAGAALIGTLLITLSSDLVFLEILHGRQMLPGLFLSLSMPQQKYRIAALSTRQERLVELSAVSFG